MKRKMLIVAGFALAALTSCAGSSKVSTSSLSGTSTISSTIVTHKHNYTETEVLPDCVNNGYKLYKCECGDTYKEATKYALGHDFDIVEKDTNTLVYKCSRCKEEQERELSISLDYMYGYIDLARYLKGTEYKSFYLKLYSELLSFDESKTNPTRENYTINGTSTLCYKVAEIDYSKYEFASSLSDKKAVVKAIYRLIMLDHPELFYLSNQVVLGDGKLFVLADQKYKDVSDIQEVKNKLEEYEFGLAGKSLEEKACQEKVKIIHDYICETTEYAYKNDGTNSKEPDDDFDAYNISGIAKNGKGVCEAYANMFTYLLRKYSIKSEVYTGTGKTVTGDVNHAWNYVEIDGNFYGFDVTWDDTNSNYLNYGLSYNDMKERHIVDENAYKSLVNNGIKYIYMSPSLATNNLN